MIPIFLAITFSFGFLVRLAGLPPLVGYLLAGIILHLAGAEADSRLDDVAEIGISLLLFLIGLKLDWRNLLRPAIWGGTTLHTGILTLLLAPILWVGTMGGLSLLTGLSLASVSMIAFALCFSSTIYVTKMLQDKGELDNEHGRVAIGILIMQDIFAVIFMAVAAGKVPTLYALLLLLIPLIRPLIFRIVDHTGHGEMLLLFGFCLTFFFVQVFELAGVKGELGAIAAGVLLSEHHRASELSKLMINLKDLLLIAFFLNIGLNYDFGLNMLVFACGLVLILPLKSAFFYLLLSRLGIPPRTAFLSALALFNYSEFGLIVLAVASNAGLLTPNWLTILAIALAISFMVAAPLNRIAHRLYARWEPTLFRIAGQPLLTPQVPEPLQKARIAVIGMGRVGGGAYNALQSRYGKGVVGIDANPSRVEKLREKGINLITADGNDCDFWGLMIQTPIEVIMLAMPNHTENLSVLERAKQANFKGRIAAVARYDDEVHQLKTSGAETAFNIYEEAGAGFANHVCDAVGRK